MPDLLTAVVFLPAIGSILLTFFPPLEHKNLKAGAIGLTSVTFVLSLVVYARFDPDLAGFQLEKNSPWIEAFGIHYHLGVDGLSLFLVLLTTGLVPLTLLSAWTAIESRVREFVIAVCILETGMLGAFVALDLFLFYVFWEAMLIPMYFLIGIWGGQRRIYAAIKFFLFTMTGSLLMLVAILFVAAQPAGGFDFDLNAALLRTYPAATERLLFLAFALAFAIKVPMFPLHTWLPDAHTEAPTAGSVILAAVLLKLGIYGLIRFAFPLFPHAAFKLAPLLGWLAVAGILWGALAAWVQSDVKKLVAYSSVSHLGFCVLGVAALNVEAITGSIYQMLAHGISTGGLFLLVGILYERRHTRQLADYGGIARRVPKFAFFFVLIALASAGLPALCGFPGEFLILLGTFTAGAPLNSLSTLPWLGAVQTHHILATIAASGVILAAVYLLWMVQKVLFGPLQDPANERLADLNSREIATLAPLALIAIFMGVAPNFFLRGIEPSAQRFVAQMYARAGKDYHADPGAKRLMRAQADPAPAAGPTNPSVFSPPLQGFQRPPLRLMKPGMIDGLRSPSQLLPAAPPTPPSAIEGNE